MRATTREARPPSRYMPNSAAPCMENGPSRASSGTRSEISRRYTGSRAEQVMSGADMIVAIRSREDGMVRVAMIPGTAHAVEDSMATKARRPGRCGP